ncbi:MAG: hypothetical protein VX496_06480 [Planctomycetota bacterium]|nr:hypothetical protein [Planctomycetota bacterium]
MVDEAVVAGGALEIGAEKDLRDVLGRLDLRALALVDHPAPLDSADKTVASRHRTDELVDKPVVGEVVVEAPVEPLGDLPPAAVDKACSLVGVAEHVVPEGEPVPGVAPLVSEEAVDGGLPGRGRIGHRLARRRQQADQVKIGPAAEGRR